MFSLYVIVTNTHDPLAAGVAMILLVFSSIMHHINKPDYHIMIQRTIFAAHLIYQAYNLTLLVYTLVYKPLTIFNYVNYVAWSESLTAYCTNLVQHELAPAFFSTAFFLFIEITS